MYISFVSLYLTSFTYFLCTFKVLYILFIERQKIRSKSLTQGPGVQKNFTVIESHTFSYSLTSYPGQL